MSEERRKAHPVVSPERVDQVWRRIEATRRTKRNAATNGPWKAIALVAAAAAVLLVWHPWTEAEGDMSPLTLNSGDAIDGVFVGPSRVGLSDGSWLTLDEGATVVLINNSGRIVELVQRSGRVHYSVEGLGRDWRIDAGSASVEVVGTEFSIDRSEDRLRVHVEEGVVLVRSERVRDGVERVTAGESVEIDTSPPPMEARLPAESLLQEPAPSEPLLQEPAAFELRRSDPLLAEPAGVGTGLAEPPSRNAVRRNAVRRNAADLMNAADAARRAGRRGEAEELLEEAIRLGDGDSDLAALTIARALQSSAPRRAAGFYEQAVELGLAEPLRREALRAQAESVEAAGGNATAAWRRFYEAYPDEPVRVLP